MSPDGNKDITCLLLQNFTRWHQPVTEGLTRASATNPIGLKVHSGTKKPMRFEISEDSTVGDCGRLCELRLQANKVWA